MFFNQRKLKKLKNMKINNIIRICRASGNCDKCIFKDAPITVCNSVGTIAKYLEEKEYEEAAK